MKKLLIYFVVAVCLCGAFVSCSKEAVSISGNSADFVVTNKTTGKTIENKGLNINLGGGGDFLEVSAGDVLELVYTPESEFQKYSWRVDFKLFNDEVVTVASSPYKHTFTVGHVQPNSYYFTCNASINDSDVDSEGVVTGSVKVKVVE